MVEEKRDITALPNIAAIASTDGKYKVIIRREADACTVGWLKEKQPAYPIMLQANDPADIEKFKKAIGATNNLLSDGTLLLSITAPCEGPNLPLTLVGIKDALDKAGIEFSAKNGLGREQRLVEHMQNLILEDDSALKRKGRSNKNQAVPGR